jgi:hypothetical protein
MRALISSDAQAVQDWLSLVGWLPGKLNQPAPASVVSTGRSPRPLPCTRLDISLT